MQTANFVGRCRWHLSATMAVLGHRFVGMDVHAETMAVAVAEGRDGAARSLGTIANRSEAVRRLLGKLSDPAKLKVCYEAGPTRLRAVTAPAAATTRPAARGPRPSFVPPADASLPIRGTL
jgi:hypothetical protein